MVQVALSGSEFAELQAQDVDELYASLAITDAGTAGTMGLNLGSLKSLKSVMHAEEVASGGIWAWLVKTGKSLFEDLWPTAKSVVCAVYREDGKDSDLKGWVAKAAAAIVGLLSITAAAAILVVTIALKLGLDALCGTGNAEAG